MSAEPGSRVPRLAASRGRAGAPGQFRRTTIPTTFAAARGQTAHGPMPRRASRSVAQATNYQETLPTPIIQPFLLPASLPPEANFAGPEMRAEPEIERKARWKKAP